VISVSHVTKTYETSAKTGLFRKKKIAKTAVQDLSLEIHPGSIVGLLGLNGAGKTTTIKMLATLLDPTSGSITVDGMDIAGHRRDIQSIVNMIAGGERMLYWRLTGRENLHYFGRLYGLKESVVQERTEHLLKEVELLEAGDQPVEQYSKGMKQRLQIARGLMNDPKYLFLDEPTLGLDAPIARQLRALVKSLAVKHGKGILLTSHYLQEVEELCDEVYVLNQGRLIIRDTPQAIARLAATSEQLSISVDRFEDSLADDLRRRFRIGADALTIIRDDDKYETTIGIMAASADALTPELLPWLIQANVRVRAVQIRKPTLEDAIIHLSGKGANAHDSVSASAAG